METKHIIQQFVEELHDIKIVKFKHQERYSLAVILNGNWQSLLAGIVGAACSYGNDSMANQCRDAIKSIVVGDHEDRVIVYFPDVPFIDDIQRSENGAH
jgi:hypothetical protein